MDKVYWTLTTSLYLADLAIRIALSLRVIMRKKAASESLAWLVVILLIPFAGAIVYLLFGENRLGQKRANRAAAELHIFKEWIAGLIERYRIDWSKINPECKPLHQQALSTIGLPTMPGNHITLISSPDDFFDCLIEDIDHAKSSCYLEFYIWAEGGVADKVADALIRASLRGVSCRILLDSIGSDEFLKGRLAASMRNNGIAVVEALPAGIFRALFMRIDLRNHRKIAIIDGDIAYSGSQNLVDPIFFKQEEGLGQWIDTMVRVTGPVVEVMSASFLYDWYLENDITLEEAVNSSDIHPVEPTGDALIQLAPSGPGFPEDAIHNLLLTTIYAAREELVLTTPYFVPDNAILAALKSAAQRDVEVTLIVPEKVDSKLVDYASRARYGSLLAAGVKIMLFKKDLLHAKIITVDKSFSLIGSVNLDMRSFWLNFELSLFVYDTLFTRELRELQDQYIRAAKPINFNKLQKRSIKQRFLENCALLVGPLL